jgi:hypothetical protein
MTVPTAIENTQKEINDYYRTHSIKGPTITLKDVRDLPEVKAHPEVFSDKTSVFFRTDLLRPVAAYKTLINIDKKEPTAFVYADLDIAPLPQNKLLNLIDLINLKKYGLVVAHSETAFGYENSFQIFGNKRKTLNAIQAALIKPQIQDAYSVLSDPTLPIGYLSGQVYAGYRPMFSYLYFLKGMGSFKSGTEIYGQNKQNIEPLIHDYANLEFVPTGRMPYRPGYESGEWKPTKKVPLPNVGGKYWERSQPD